MTPTVIALIGLPGTGKSTLGRRLLPSLPREVAYLDLDTLTRPLVRAALAVARMDPVAADAIGTLRVLRDAQYACLFDQLRSVVAFGRDAMFVAPMTHELDDPARFRRAVESLRPARVVLIRTHATRDVVRARLEARQDFLDPLRLARWEEDERRYVHPAPLPMPGLEVDTTAGPLDAHSDEARAWIARHTGWRLATASPPARHAARA